MRIQVLITTVVTGTLAAAVAAPPAARAADEPSLEQLLNTEVVGVSRAQERLLDAPASVTVVTAEEIRGFGWRTLAELLNGVRGVFTYTDRAYGYIGVRGFAPVGDYNTRVLLLIDGYRANDNVYDQAPIGREGLIDLDLIERVEVIRGPASSVYGTSAFFGVINIVTRSASSMTSGARLLAGSGRERGGSATLAGQAGDSGYWYLRATRIDSRGTDIVLGQAADRLPFGGRASGVDGSELTRVFARAIFGAWRLTAGDARRTQDAGFGLYGSDFGAPQSFVRDRQSFGDLRWDGSVGLVTDVTLRAYVARYSYGDTMPFAGEGTTGATDGRWAGTELQLTHRLSAGHRLLGGIEAQRDSQLRQSQATDALGLVLDDRRSGSRLGVFVQDDIEWSAAWSTSAGLRYDRYRGGEQASPRGALIFRPDGRSALKLVAGSAFRAPNAYERYYAFDGLYAANPALNAERIATVDLDYSTLLGDRTRLGVGAYRYRASDLIAQALNADGLLQFVNLASASAHGVDAEVEHELRRGLRLRGVWSWQRLSDAHGEPIDNSPSHVVKAAVLWRIAGAGWTLGTEAVRVDRRRSFAGQVPAYVQTNVTLASPVARRGLDLSLSVFNLFDRDIQDPVLAGGLPGDADRIPQPGRGWRMTLGYAF
jgi:iron complex outermembrane receptor protein